MQKQKEKRKKLDPVFIVDLLTDVCGKISANIEDVEVVDPGNGHLYLKLPQDIKYNVEEGFFVAGELPQKGGES